MRIRGTKPEFWRSERIASVEWHARLVLKGLESYVDDNGVGKDDLALIVGDLFQRDLVREPSRTLARVSEAIAELAGAGLLWRYDFDGTQLLYISFWETVQRVDKAQAGRFPRPDGTYNYKDSSIRESVESPREPSRTFAPVTGEQGNRGTGEQILPSDAEASDAAEGDEYSDEVKRLCELLAAQVRANGHKVGTVGSSWWSACERLMRLDGYTGQQIEWLIGWTTADEFWSANIRSMPKFREKFSTLKAQAQANPQGRGGSQKQQRALSLIDQYQREESGHEEVGSGGTPALGAGGGSQGSVGDGSRGVA